MTNETKNVPELRFPGFEDEWEETKIKNISNTFSGGTPASNKTSYYNGNIPFIRSGEIAKLSTELHINNNALQNSSAKLIEKGDLLFALYGATSGEVAISKIKGELIKQYYALEPQNLYYFYITFLS
ncbi:restriction endonuclease subunit S [Staphylococcus auricularis]|uniref:restriction endonuclease subunit S n=1 Tax=Staphylococcus auricularis TaxID=29379 RepID=UPI003EBE4B75